jgi:outer membrane protein assembly factor BamB
MSLRAHLVLTPLLLLMAGARAPAQDAWPQFRGAQASGVADTHPLPSEWSVEGEAGPGVRWRTPIPGLAHASPVVWGERVFVATAVAKGLESSLKIGLYGAGDSADDMVEHAYQLWCLDLHTGHPIWVRTAVDALPKFARHTKATQLDATPVTDGEHVVAVFGAHGMFCFTVDGDLLWRTEVGDLDVGPHDAMDLHWGFASSPVIAEGKVVLQADIKQDPYLAAWDVATGALAWRVARDDTTSWATPTVVGEGDDAQIVVNGCKHMGAYALADGAEIWRMPGGGGLPIPAPIVSGDLLLLTSNHRPLELDHPQKPVFAVRRSARGALPIPSRDAPGEHVAWMQTKVGNYIQTPIVYGEHVYLCSAQGIVTILDAATGEQHGRHRLGAGGVGFSASPVAGDGKLYFTSEEGDVHVVRAGLEFEPLSTSRLGEICMATPAIAAGTILFRTRGHVVAVGVDED